MQYPLGVVLANWSSLKTQAGNRSRVGSSLRLPSLGGLQGWQMGSQALTPSSLLAWCHLCASSPGWGLATVAVQGTERPACDKGDEERPQRGSCPLSSGFILTGDTFLWSCHISISLGHLYIANRGNALCTQSSVWQSLCTLSAS